MARAPDTRTSHEGHRTRTFIKSVTYSQSVCSLTTPDWSGSQDVHLEPSWMPLWDELKLCKASTPPTKESATGTWIFLSWASWETRSGNQLRLRAFLFSSFSHFMSLKCVLCCEKKRLKQNGNAVSPSYSYPFFSNISLSIHNSVFSRPLPLSTLLPPVRCPSFSS